MLLSLETSLCNFSYRSEKARTLINHWIKRYNFFKRHVSACLCLEWQVIRVQVIYHQYYWFRTHISSYRFSSNDLKKHRNLRTLKNDHNIIILKPDKGNGVVILDHNIYLDSCFNESKFKLLDNDPTLLREGRLKRFISQLKRKRSIDDDT